MKGLRTGIAAAVMGCAVIALFGCGGGGGGSSTPTDGGTTPPAQKLGWTTTASLKTARFGHTATLLPNGKVLVVGGDSAPISEAFMPTARNYVSGVEQYDPAAKTWTTTGNLHTARMGHTSTVLPNGKVLVVGGWSDPNSPRTEVELYDTATHTAVAGPSPAILHLNHTATMLPNGKVLVVGGRANGQSAYVCELYDPASNTWIAGPTMLEPRQTHMATLLPSGKVLVLGGYGESGQSLGPELYDPDTNTWASAAKPSDRRWSTATLLHSGKVLLIPWMSMAGTAATEIYEPASNTWSVAAPITTSNSGHTATLLPNGNVMMIGGGDYYVKSGRSYGSEVATLFDANANTWVQADKLILGSRLAHAATLLPNGSVLVVGGVMGSTAQAEAALYGPL